MTKIVLWRGFHSAKLLEVLQEALDKKILCLLCPPHLKNYSFMNYLPPGEMTFIGDWEASDLVLAKASAEKRSSANYPELPQFGVFTSGTLSFNPSLVLFKKEAVEDSLQSILDLFQPAWAEKIICYPQPFHIFGLTLGYLQSLLWKKPLFTPDGRYQKSFHDLWLKEDRKGLLTLGAPVHFFDLLQRIPSEQKTTASSCICGGARVSPELWQGFQQKLGIEYPSIGYGATEACPGLSHLPPGVAPQESGDIGFWLKGVETKSHPNGFEFRGPNKCMAMVEEKSPGVFSLEFPDRILIRDELAQNAERLVYKGRSDLKMNRGGEKYSLELIEEKIQSHLGIPVLAVAIPDMRLGEKLGLLLQSRANSAQLKAICKDLVEQELAWSIHSDEIGIFENFPTNTNGKWDRKKATELLSEK